MTPFLRPPDWATFPCSDRDPGMEMCLLPQTGLSSCFNGIP